MKAKPKGARSRKLILVALGLCLTCGCAGKIVPMMSKNSFMVEGASSDAEAIKDANAFCGKQGKTAIISPIGRGSMARGEIMFMCASPEEEPGIPPNTQPAQEK